MMELFSSQPVMTYLSIILCMEADQSEERDGIEHYLRALRKKVDHQVKNPFDLAFANFSFEELASWKNNVLQLDATSRLYGQRVDFLHCGALQILGSVLSNQEAVRESAEQRQQEIRREQPHDALPFEKHLELPQRISCEVEQGQSNLMLWREVCKKRDALHQLMLNELPIDRNLGLVLVPDGAAAVGEQYEQVLTDQSIIYMKLLDFRALSPKGLSIFAEIEAVSSSVDNFMASYAGKARGDSAKVEPILEYDFHCLDFDAFADLQGINFEDGINCPDLSEAHLENEEQQPQEEIDEEEQEYEESQDYFELEDWNRNEKANREPKTKRKKREGARERREEMVDFGGMPLERSLILLPEIQEQEIQEKYICPRDYLLLKFVKYGHPMPKKTKKATASKFKPLNEHLPPQTAFESMPCSNPLEESFSWNPVTNLSRMSQVRFKEAALPIKEMKKRIKEKVDLQQKQLVFEDIRKAFAKEEALDIFISVLHIAAEEQAFVIM